MYKKYGFAPIGAFFSILKNAEMFTKKGVHMLKLAIPEVENKSKILTFKTLEFGDMDIIAEEILYFSASNHNVIIHFTHKEFSIRKALNDLENEMREFHFVRPHRGYFVNLRYIQSIKPRAIFLENGVKIPIGRGNFERVKEVYREYAEGR
jgi:hypothetical protein